MHEMLVEVEVEAIGPPSALTPEVGDPVGATAEPLRSARHQPAGRRTATAGWFARPPDAQSRSAPLALVHLGQVDRRVAAAAGQVPAPGGPDVARPVALRQAGDHVPAAVQVNGDTGVGRGSPVRRPGTVSTWIGDPAG